MNTNYQTISKNGESLYKVKGSKHFGYTFNVKNEDDIQEKLEQVKQIHHSARHVCYAWRLGVDKDRFRANDDGEPSNSAGKPILGQIEKYDLTNVLVAVVRYFGGTKLGVGGLIDAYRTAASMAIDESKIIKKQLLDHYRISFEYDRMSEVMLALRKNNWDPISQDFQESCTIELAILPEEKERLKFEFQAFGDITLKFIDRY